jgi:hypothetical protein
MKATIYDSQGKPTAHIEYDTPFEMYWRGVRRLLITVAILFVLFFIFLLIR